MNKYKLEEEFDLQINTYISKCYHEAAGLSTGQFQDLIEPLRGKWEGITLPLADPENGRLPFILVVQRVSAEKAMSLVEREGKQGIVSMYPVEPDSFSPIRNVDIPGSPAYLLLDMDKGEDTRNITPDEALKIIENRERSPLTIEEGLATLIQYPNFLKKNGGYYLPASRRDDKRVPALWLSEGKPKLGWCWAGNPHTWLGSASCACRLGY